VSPPPDPQCSRFWAIVCEEPFRIFFPAGVLLGLIGVSLWPLFYFGIGLPYPNVAHARLMVEGFMASFIFGFLGTAGPRLTSAPHFSFAELGAIFTLVLLAAGLHISGADRTGDVCFLICLIVFTSAVAKRFHQRKDSPPPNFVLVGLGLAAATVGTFLIADAETAQYSKTYQFGNALLNGCWVLFQVLGVAPFFVRRLLDLPTPDLPESRALPPGWKRNAAFAAAVGIAIIVSFWIDIINWPRLGGWIRVVAIGTYVAAQLPFRGRSFLANCLRAALMSIFAGVVVLALLPIYRVGALHIIFISGFTFLAFTVAIRVIFGHSGRTDLLRKRLSFFIIAGVLIFLAAISRYVADLAPKARIVHLVAAAVCWIIATVIWTIRVLPKATRVQAEP
jgi:uncharacterized protein involved in response to NO